MSLVDYASLAPGALNAANAVGGFQNIAKDPKRFMTEVIASYFGYNMQTRNFDPSYAWERQWKPFVIIQLGQAILGRTRFGKRLKRTKFLGMTLMR